MKHARILPLWLTTLLLSACVTINIYFPAAAAEKAADRIIEEVWGPKEEGAEPTPAPQSRGMEEGGALLAALEWLIPPAQAAAPDLNIDTPAIRALRASMRGRHARLADYYANGAVGLGRDGLLVTRDPGAVPLRERNSVKTLVAQENRDRNALYREIAKANGHPEWESQIRATFAQRWRHNARRGWWVQDAGGRWSKK